MRYRFYREHKYVSFALNDLERCIAKTDFREQSQVEMVRRQFDDTVEMLKGHAHYENSRLHTLLKNKGSDLFIDVEEDHQHQDEQIAGLHEILNQIESSTNEQIRLDMGYQFYLTFRKFVGDNLLHLHEEETLILPELQKLYSDEELRAVEFDSYHQMTPDHIHHMTQILFPHMNASDREAILKDIKDSEPEKFLLAWEGIKNGLDPKEQCLLIENLPIPTR